MKLRKQASNRKIPDKKLAKTLEKWYIFLMFKTLFKFIFFGFIIWFVLTQTGLKIKSENPYGAGLDRNLPENKYSPECYERMKSANFDQAVVCYKQALIGDVANPEKRYYLALSMLLDKDFEGAKFHSEFIMNNLPNSDYAPFARKIFDAALIASSEKKELEDGAGADYLSDLDFTRPWQKMPLKVWMQHTNNNSNLRRAFNIWQTALYPTVSFQMVSTRDEADIIVIFDDPKAQCSSKLAVGCTSGSYISKNGREHTIKAVISLTSFDPSGGRISDNQLFAVLSHEIGHALGLSGHSKNRSDIMYPDTSNYTVRLSKRDINTIRRIYGK